MQGKLFTQDFLREGIRETDAWQRLWAYMNAVAAGETVVDVG